MIRQLLPLEALRGERHFRWRGGDVSRIEGLTDAVIALSLTLLVVSLEVPNTFDELLASFRQLPAFAVCFALLVMTWYYHFQFHRRFGLENLYTVFLNAFFLFLVLFYVYPLKFLFTRLFDMLLYDGGGFSGEDGRLLMLLYSGGVVGIFGLFVLMYVHAWRNRDVLELDEVERHVTRTTLRSHTIHLAIGGTSFLLALADPRLAPWAGLVYFLEGPAQGLNGWLSGRALGRLPASAGPG